MLVLLFCTQAIAESSLWTIQKGGSITYLGGTCHLLRQSDFPLPPEFYKAYGASDILVFETDIAELKTKTPKLYKELIIARNEKWHHSIDSYQKTPQKEFILVGVGHLVGSDGIVEALQLSLSLI